MIRKPNISRELLVTNESNEDSDLEREEQSDKEIKKVMEEGKVESRQHSEREQLTTEEIFLHVDAKKGAEMSFGKKENSGDKTSGVFQMSSLETEQQKFVMQQAQ